MASAWTNSKNTDIDLNSRPEGITDQCVHCGFCLPTCPSYRILGTEMDSPRGRIHTLKAIENGELGLDATVASHFDTCLGCFACVSACPSGVRYDQLIENTRPRINKLGLRAPCKAIFRELLLLLLPYPRRLRAVLQVLRAYAGTPIQKLAQKFGFTRLMGPQLEAMEALLPPLAPENFRDGLDVLNPTKEKRRGRVGLVLGCVQRCFDPDVNKATIEVLQANGFEVVIPKNQGCCGAITHHQGQIEQTKELANQLIQSFASVIGPARAGGEEELEAVLVAASGCGHTMKSYDHLLDRNKNFKSPVMDVHEFLRARGLCDSFRKSLRPLLHHDGNPAKAEHPMKVVYHDACHLIHGQGISTQPRELLKEIPHLVLCEAKDPNICCGSAGIYNLLQPEEATQLGQLKTKDLHATGADLIASANIGCTMQLRRHLSERLLVAHPMQLLAYSAGIHQPPSLK